MKTRMLTSVREVSGSLIVYVTKACAPLNIRPGEQVYVTIERATGTLKDPDMDTKGHVEIFR